MSEPSSSKDNWDKAEIIGKIAIGSLVPIVLGISAIVLNNQISQRSRSADMIRIAVGILQEDPAEEAPDNALRLWAISVLQNPADENALTEEAASQLRNEPLSRVADLGAWPTFI
ncbi:hypothetical protein HKCCE2091_20665 [Rhodobacterales bacterium HKCCE2091]|nr:hypothetical protein [Rhodobacterales bacterium HKCCE2091]